MHIWVILMIFSFSIHETRNLYKRITCRGKHSLFIIYNHNFY